MEKNEAKYKSLFKDTIIFAIGSFGSKLILFFLVPLYTNFMSTAEYGTADLVTTFSSLIIPLTSLVINQAVIRFGMMKSEKPENVAVASFVVLGISTLATICLTPLFGLYKTVSEWRWYLTIMVIVSNFSEVERTYLKVKNKNRTFAMISILQTAVLACSNILLLTVMRLGVSGYLTSNIVALIFSAIIAFFAAGLHHDLFKGKFDKVLLKRMVAYSFPLIFSNISWWVVNSSDKVMIEWMIGASLLGVYTAATKIPSLINVIIAIFNQAWAISSIKEAESTNKSNYHSSVFNIFSTLLFGTCILILTVIKPFMQIYVGSDFRDAWMYAVFLLTAAVFYSLSAFIGTIYAAIQKTTNDMWTNVLCATINIIINYFGIKAIGTWGAVFATLAAYFVVANIRIIDIKRYIPFNINLRAYLIDTILLLMQAVLVVWSPLPYLVSAIVILLFVISNRNYIIHLTRSTMNIVRR